MLARVRWFRSLVLIVGTLCLLTTAMPSVVATSPRAGVTAIGPRSDCKDVICG